jgi:glutamate dehydrogenase/leucine dehydrogenase
MRKGLDRYEVESLAKTMEVKFTVSGPAIGGAKSGIDFDPTDSRKRGVLRRWLKVVTPLLKSYYGTGGDLNVDEMLDVVPITEAYGLWHPQEGVVAGHFGATAAERVRRIGQLRLGVAKIVEDPRYSPALNAKSSVADLITGWSVSESVRHFYRIYGGSVADKRVIVQGWGNVGAAAAYYLAQSGASIVGIIDRSGGILRPDGLSFDEVRHLYLRKDGNTLVAPDLLSFDEVNRDVWDLPAEVFLPCAASRLVTLDQVDRLVSAGLETVSCGAKCAVRRRRDLLRPGVRTCRQKCCRHTGFHRQLRDGQGIRAPDGR